MPGGLTPKGKMSRSRTRSRRAQWLRLSGPSLVRCKHCREQTLAHAACTHCGWYGGREVVDQA